MPRSRVDIMARIRIDLNIFRNERYYSRELIDIRDMLKWCDRVKTSDDYSVYSFIKEGYLLF